MYVCLLMLQDSDRLDLWSQNWNLLFSKIKCSLVRFSSSLPVHPSLIHIYFIHDQPVTIQKIHKDLGVIMSSDLSWKEQYVYLSSKTYRVICGELSVR